jgi:hypothetical protein
MPAAKTNKQMENRIIRIENGIVSVPQSGEVWMTQHEIAALFDVYVQTVNANIKAVLKTGVIKVDTSCPLTIAGNTILPDVYSLEMIITLAFRIRSYNAEVLRRWTIWKVSKMELPEIWKISVQNPILN